MKEKLIDYMIPSILIKIDKIPITINGKLDIKALPEPEFSGNLNNYIAPRNEIEEKLIGIWQDVLGIEKIGITDNFFELGGHSLKITKMLYKIKHTTLLGR